MPWYHHVEVREDYDADNDEYYDREDTVTYLYFPNDPSEWWLRHLVREHDDENEDNDGYRSNFLLRVEKPSDSWLRYEITTCQTKIENLVVNMNRCATLLNGGNT